MPDSPTAIASTWSASAATPGAIQGAFTVSAATPGAIQGAFTVSAATPGPIEGLYRSTYASITIAPTGDTGNNQFLLTSLVPFTGGNAISFQMLAFAGSATTDVTVTDFAIVVTPGALARMTISGTTPSVATTVFLAADYDFGPRGLLYTSDGVSNYGGGAGRTAIYDDGTTWYLWHWDNEGNLDYTATKVSSATSPNGLTGWTVSLGSGQPTINSAGANASQVIDAINNNVAASSLVVASLASTGLGVVAAVSTVNLSGGGVTVVPAVAPASIQGAFSVSASTPGSIQGAFSVSASTPGAIQGAFTASAAQPGPIQGAFSVSAATPGAIQAAWSISPAVPGAIA